MQMIPADMKAMIETSIRNRFGRVKCLQVEYRPAYDVPIRGEQRETISLDEHMPLEYLGAPYTLSLGLADTAALVIYAVREGAYDKAAG